MDKHARVQLAGALEWLRDGDVLIVTKLDRLARSVSDLLPIVETVAAKKGGPHQPMKDLLGV